VSYLRLQLSCHAVEGVGQAAHLVMGGKIDSPPQITTHHAFGQAGQPPQRAGQLFGDEQSQQPGQQSREKRDGHDGAAETGHIGLNLSQG